MVENVPSTEKEAASPKAKKNLRKGALVRVNKAAFVKSVEALASDQNLPDYIFKGPGEVLAVKDEYAQVRWRMPVPDVWFRVDQLEDWS